MNFSRVLAVLVVLAFVFIGHSEGNWLKKLLKPVEKAGQRVREATKETIGIAQQGANVVATLAQAGVPVAKG